VRTDTNSTGFAKERQPSQINVRTVEAGVLMQWRDEMFELDDEGILVFMIGFCMFVFGIFGTIVNDMETSMPFVNIIIFLCSIMMIVGAIMLIMLGIFVIIIMLYEIVERR